MKDLLNIAILTKTFDDLPHGVGIFHILDLNDIESIQYVFINKVLLYEMKKERDEVIGKKIIEVAPEAYEHEGGLQVIETYRKVAAEGGSINLGLVEYSNHLVAGTYECSVHHIEGNYVYVMLRNVTELEKAKRDLEQKNKELSQFAHLVSHDLKEPLNSLTGLIQLLETECEGKLDQKANEIFRLVAKSTTRMKNLIRDILDYSAIGQEKHKTLVDCNKLVRVIKQDLKMVIKETNATIEVEDLPQVKGYPTELRLLFQNLISNGIKFSKPGVPPKIKISAKENDGWTFAIRDNGIGIANEHQEQIFAIFQRLHTRSEIDGTGIGLTHCKKIVELHSGEIWIKSKPREGSTFYFTIPKQ